MSELYDPTIHEPRLVITIVKRTQNGEVLKSFAVDVPYDAGLFETLKWIANQAVLRKNA